MLIVGRAALKPADQISSFAALCLRRHIAQSTLPLRPDLESFLNITVRVLNRWHSIRSPKSFRNKISQGWQPFCRSPCLKGCRHGLAGSYQSVLLLRKTIPQALANLETLATFPTANLTHTTQRRSLAMAAPVVMATPMSSPAALRRVVDSCPLAHSKTMATL